MFPNFLESVFKNFAEFTKTSNLGCLCNKVIEPLPESLLKKDPGKIFKSLFHTEHLRVPNSGSPGRYLKAYQSDIIEAIIVTLMLTLNVFLSFVITLEVPIQNNLIKSWRLSREKSVVEFRYSMKL